MSKLKTNSTLQQIVNTISFNDKCDLIYSMFIHKREFIMMIKNLMQRPCGREMILTAISTRVIIDLLRKKGYEVKKRKYNNK